MANRGKSPTINEQRYVLLMTVALERHSALAHAPGGGTSAVGGPFGRKTWRSVSTAAAPRGTVSMLDAWLRAASLVTYFPRAAFRCAEDTALRWVRSDATEAKVYP